MSVDPPRRWADLPAGGSGPEARAGELARAAKGAPPALSAGALAAIEARLASGAPPRGGWHKPVAVASIPAAAFIVWLLLRTYGGTGELKAAPPATAPAEPARVAAVEPAPMPVPDDPLPEVQPEPAKRPAVARAPARPAVKPQEPAPAEESSLLVETRMLRAALEELRQKHDAGAALRALDAYFERFPSGALRNEALVARVDAQQALGRRDDALATLNELERAGFAGAPRVLELKVLRGELLSAKDRCAEAVPQFDRCLSEALSGPLEERARVGRASCRGRLGDAEGSRADLERYLERFPAGRFAEQARAALGK